MLGSARPDPMALSTPPPADPSRAFGAVRPNGTSALAHPLPAGMRDLVPGEARRLLTLTRTILESFELFGYEAVSVPPFEYAQVLEEDMGPLDAGQVLRFVEPETGEVVALRPDMTPQVARLVATRLGDAPLPARLCYEGAVVRRRAERARRDRQIHQAGFELVGLGSPAGDLEVLTVAASAVRAAGLDRFTLDLGHAGIASSLVAGAEPAVRARILEALAAKDVDETERRARASGIAGAELAALVALPSLCGGREVFDRAAKVFAGTAAEGPTAELFTLCDQAISRGLSPSVLIDLGETWNFAYYTGVMFQVLADGPGEAVGSGGRYDRLFDRFGAPRPAAGFAIDLGNLGWALERAGGTSARPSRVLVVRAGADPASIDEFLSELRRQGVPAAEAPETGAVDYARTWRYTHRVELSRDALVVVDVATDERRTQVSKTPRDAVRAALALLGSKIPDSEVA